MTSGIFAGVLPRDLTILVPVTTLALIVIGIIHGMWVSLRTPGTKSEKSSDQTSAVPAKRAA